MSDKNLPNPIQKVMMDGLPELPNIIENAMPITQPQMQYRQNPISMIFGNFKRGQLEKATMTEANIARNSKEALFNKLDSIGAIVTYSARISDSFNMYEHLKVMRDLEQKRMTLENKKLEIETYKLHADAITADFESKMSELDYKLRLRQYDELVGEK
jgi:hypothetical protein